MNIFELAQRISYAVIRDKRYHYYDKFKKNLYLSKEEIQQLQNHLIQKLIDHAYSHTNYYKELMDSLHLKPIDIKCREDLKKMPALTKSLIRQNMETIISDDSFAKNIVLVTSGGSTGNQAIIYKSSYYDQVTKAISLRNNLIAGWKPSDRSVWLWGAPYEHERLKKSIVAKIGILVNRRMLFNTFNYSPEDFPTWIDRIHQYKPKVLYGYATVILEFAVYLLENSVQLPSINLVISTTETLRKREIIEKAFNCEVINQYGCREILGIGIESAKGVMRIADDNVALYLNEEGEFIVTALHSYGFPLINYKLGDYGEILDTKIKTEDNLPFSAMNIKIGRTTDNFLTKDNRTVSASALSTYMSTFILYIKEQQIIQSSHKDFTVNFVPDYKFDEVVYKNSITNALKEYFGEDLKIKFKKMNKIPLERSGKKLMFKRTFLRE